MNAPVSFFSDRGEIDDHAVRQTDITKMLLIIIQVTVGPQHHAQFFNFTESLLGMRIKDDLPTFQIHFLDADLMKIVNNAA